MADVKKLVVGIVVDVLSLIIGICSIILVIKYV